MKRMTKMLALLMAGFAMGSAGAMALSDARAQIGTVIGNPAQMTAVMKQLSAADQQKFIGEVNAAIAKMPASREEQIATYLNLNKAALVGASKGNLIPLLGEVFATVPVDALTVINERFAADLFNRAANPGKAIPERQFFKVATNAMGRIDTRLKDVDDRGVRDTFATLMLVRASNLAEGKSPEDVAKAVAAAGQALGVTEVIDRAAAISEGAAEAAAGATAGAAQGQEVNVEAQPGADAQLGAAAAAGNAVAAGAEGQPQGEGAAADNAGNAAAGQQQGEGVAAGNVAGNAGEGQQPGGVAVGGGEAIGGGVGGGIDSISDPLGQLIAGLVSQLPADSQKEAISEWLVDALQAEPSYDNIIASSIGGGSERAVELPVIMAIAGEQLEAALMADLASGNAANVTGTLVDVINNPEQYGGSGLGGGGLDSNIPDVRREPGGYQWQFTR